ncbi:cytochrome P450 [Striga asiatica]|uniref:Cytochrome P450 n=1 Tax=Striga asiatica TaxID=4170 RepID=A0A5A7QYZ4_STRAF|nr:cytochrome P450 [Striga asiatica]
MAATIGWYGPLIDLCKAFSYIGDFVQLLVYVHRSTPVQYKIARNGGEVVRMDVLVGDETRSYFPVTIWQKQMGAQVSAGLDKVIGECRVGITTKDKLQRVVGWMQRAKLAHCGSALNCFEHRGQLKINWKVHEDTNSQDCTSLSELYEYKENCKATFHASVGELFLPITWVELGENEAERMFISRRLHNIHDQSLVDDLITTGCQLCGTPVNARPGSSVEQNISHLYCPKSSNRFHTVGTIYRPFLLYVWDDVKYLPISVKNKGAEILFGNISAEKVHSSYKDQRAGKDGFNPHPSSAGQIFRMKDKFAEGCEKPNFYMIWLILLRTLFQHEKNSPLRFKVKVDTNRDWENGRLEMLSVSIPAFKRNRAASSRAVLSKKTSVGLS